MKHPTKQNHLQPPKTSQNYQIPAKTTQNYQQLSKTTHNQMVWNYHTKGRNFFSPFYLILQFVENNLRYNNTQKWSFTGSL